MLLLGLVAVCALAAVVVKARVDTASRGYSDTRGARVVHYTLASRLVHRNLAEIAVIPAGGGDRPLLVLLHGRHDRSRLAWLVGSKTGPQAMLNDAFFAGLARLGRNAPVVLLPNGGGHSYYHDRRDGSWGSMVLDEAISDAQRRFHTTRHIAIGGISMGGYGALHLASLRPREFCAVGGHSAALWEAGGTSAPGAFDDAADFARNDVFAAARRGRFDGLPVWLDGGTRDPFRAADAALVTTLRRRGVDVTYRLWPGAHTPSYWRAHMAVYLRFYARALARCG